MGDKLDFKRAINNFFREQEDREEAFRNLFMEKFAKYGFGQEVEMDHNSPRKNFVIDRIEVTIQDWEKAVFIEYSGKIRRKDGKLGKSIGSRCEIFKSNGKHLG